jgi:ABC-type transport system involved in multi-copper enzyme maturation permease subunit
VLKDENVRRSYDQARATPIEPRAMPKSTPTASDIGLFGHGLSALLCLLIGLFLLVLVRAQWIWFLWPLAILATFVIGFGILMARSAMISANTSLPSSHMLRRHTKLQEILFWIAVGTVGYGIYLLFTIVE